MTTPTDHDLPPLNATPPGLYRHYKGGWYEVIDTVRCSETLQGMTLYRALYGGFGLWVRPATMFAEHAVFEGVHQARFKPHDPALIPLGDLATAQALIAHLRGRCQRETGQPLDTQLRPPPPEPTTCCGRGCNGCVWEGFYAALDGWRTDALALIAHLRGRCQRETGQPLDTRLRPPPPEPTTCCGRGCNGCVWEGFYAALHHWRVDALALLAHAHPVTRQPDPA